jgi:triacylglycerol lipase
MHAPPNWPLLALGLGLLLILLAVGLMALRRARLRKRVPAKRAPRLRYPVVLAHGVFGFDEIALAGTRHQYFRNIASRLDTAQFHALRVPPVASVTARADKLVALVRNLPGKRLNVIAHSMGGLDARLAITRLGLSERVASLTTIGSPHFGTPLANLRISKTLAGHLAALRDLTPEALDRFNREVPDSPGVAYCSVVASSALRHTNPLLWPGHLYLSHAAGPNDGLVPRESMRWGKVLREIEADHWAQVGWSLRFDAVALYEEILRELVGLGF